MKRILLFVVILGIAGMARVQAQCTAANLNVVIKSVTSGAGGCQVILDVSFTGNFNSGNKYAFIHLWETAPVNNYPNLTYVNPPTAAELANAIATLVIVDPGKNSAALFPNYPANTSVPVKYTGVNFSKTGNVYTMSNVVINFSTCNVPVTVKGDVWASQSNLSQVVHCENDGIITILFNNPLITGIKQCSTPRRLNLSFENDHATLNESVVADVFIDMNSDGAIDAGDINITAALSPALPNPIVLPPNTQQTFNGMTYSPYSGQGQYDAYPIIVRANATAPGAATVTITKNNINFLGSCSTLPVTFTSFTAKKEGSTVQLQWETSSEQNNKGFGVERNSGGAWEQVAFVATKADGGNSNSKLVYAYDEHNSSQSMTHYRLKQVDIDGVYHYSETRSVFGDQQKARTVIYPNPSSDGKINIVLPDAGSARDISVIDMAGRIVRQWRNTRSTHLQVEQLRPGMYTLRVVEGESGKLSAEKILVHAR